LRYLKEKLMVELVNPKPKVDKHILKDDGVFPNSGLFLLIYRNVFKEEDKDMADRIEETFHGNDWKNSWRNGIYDYAHYHSITHEVLGIYSGKALVQFGGPKGINEELQKGDVVIIPAGVAHQCLDASGDFKCIGAYPEGSDYDIKKGEAADRPEADKNIEKVELPDSDPVYGIGGLLQLEWGMW
jgi:uncharacterized protein YjlB